MIINFRGQKRETIKFVNKKTGAHEQFDKHLVALEMDSGMQVMGEVDYARGESAVDLPYDKGQTILIEVSGMLRLNDVTTVKIAKHAPV